MTVLAIAIVVTGCITGDTVPEDNNKPDYQTIDDNERMRRWESCREDPYLEICQPPGS